jgi:hypothetical protein
MNRTYHVARAAKTTALSLAQTHLTISQSDLSENALIELLIKICSLTMRVAILLKLRYAPTFQLQPIAIK